MRVFGTVVALRIDGGRGWARMRKAPTQWVPFEAARCQMVSDDEARRLAETLRLDKHPSESYLAAHDETDA